METKPKLRTYRVLKTGLEYERYLDGEGKRNGRRWITNLRGGSNGLRIETGRREKLEVEERVCDICGSGEVEDERHFMMDCVMYRKEREEMYEGIKKLYDGGMDLRRVEREIRFNKLIGKGMITKYGEVYECVKVFVQAATTRRTAIIRSAT